MSTKKMAFIGAGLRATVYAKYLKECSDVESVAVADPDEQNRQRLVDTLDGAPLRHYADWRELLAEHKDLDGVAITTPNYLHADPAVACIERGMAIALEKPLAPSKADCERIIRAQRAHRGRVYLGFVLRSAPFYETVHRLIAGGAIGRITSVQADELVGRGVSHQMNRSAWRRFAGPSGGAMLEKCCHDMDILNWMMGCRPVSIHSYGSRMIFVPNPVLPDRCDDCGVARECMYDIGGPNREPYAKGLTEEDEGCIYNMARDIMDVQSVQIEYENGAVANFMLNFHAEGPKTARNFHGIGLKGRVWGNLHEPVVYHHDNASGETTEHAAVGDGSGHGGGDRKHAHLLHRMMTEPDFAPAQDAEAGYLSAVMCFAADASREQRRRIELVYRDDGFIDLK